MLQLEKVAKIYDGDEPVVALEDITMSVSDGEFVSVLGPSGCGKTTLLKLVAGLVAPTRGEILVGGDQPSEASGRTTLVFQEYNRSLLPWRTVLKNVELSLEAKGLTREERSKAAREYLDKAGLRDFYDYYPWQLSGGMQQRVAIARALAYEARLLLMDEPFGSLDARMTEELERELLRLWAELGFTVLFVTHDIDEAIFLSDRVVVLSPRPARVLECVPIGLERPRDQLQTRNSDGFRVCRERIYGLLHSEGN